MNPLRALGADRLALLALALATVLLVPQTVLLGKLPDHFDYWLQEYVHLAVLHRWLHAGELPLWNGQLVAGTPHLADPQTATLYPLTTLPLLVLPPSLVARLSIPLHFFLAGAFTYGYARRVGLSRPAALTAGLAYALAPHFAPLAVATYLQQSAAWVPAILWALHAGGENGRLAPFAVAGLLWGLQLLRGYAQTWYVTGLIAAAYALFHVLLAVNVKARAARLGTPLSVHRAGAARWLVARLAGPLVFVVAGLGLAAVQLLPSLELLGASQRSAGFTLAEASGPGRVGLANFLGLAGPDAEVSGAYPGAVILGLALAGVLYARGAHLWFTAGSAAVSLALCLGDRAPLWGLAYSVLPGFATLHMPHRMLFLWSLALALLAGYGLDALAHHVPTRGQPDLRPLVVTSAVLAGLLWLAAAAVPGLPPAAAGGAVRLTVGLIVCIAGATLQRRYRWPALALAAVAALDLLSYSAPRLYGRFYPPDAVYAAPPAAIWLQERQEEQQRAGSGPFRFASAVYRTPDAGEGAKQQDNRRIAYLPPNIPTLYSRLAAAQGYLAIRLVESGAYFDAINDLGRNARSLSIYDPRSRLLDVLGVRYFVTDDAPTFPSTAAGGRSLTLPGGDVVVAIREPWPAVAVDVLSSLGDAVDIAQGETVATITLVAADGREWSFPVQAGVHTAEWLYDSPSILGSVRHRMAPVARTTPRPDGGRAYVYLARLELEALDQPVIQELRLQVVHPSARWNVDRILLHTPFAARFRLAHRQGALHVWENLNARPRAWWTADYVVAGDQAAQLERLRDPALDPARIAVLDQALPGRPALASGTAPSAQVAGPTSGTAQVLRMTANTRQIEVTAPVDGLLIVAETLSPGWQAWVDGRPAPLHAADGKLQALPLPAGTHRVDLRYRPLSVVLGGVVSTVTLLALATWAVRSRLRSGGNTQGRGDDGRRRVAARAIDEDHRRRPAGPVEEGRVTALRAQRQGDPLTGVGP